MTESNAAEVRPGDRIRDKRPSDSGTGTVRRTGETAAEVAWDSDPDGGELVDQAEITAEPLRPASRVRYVGTTERPDQLGTVFGPANPAPLWSVRWDNQSDLEPFAEDPENLRPVQAPPRWQPGDWAIAHRRNGDRAVSGLVVRTEPAPGTGVTLRLGESTELSEQIGWLEVPVPIIGDRVRHLQTGRRGMVTRSPAASDDWFEVAWDDIDGSAEPADGAELQPVDETFQLSPAPEPAQQLRGDPAGYLEGDLVRLRGEDPGRAIGMVTDAADGQVAVQWLSFSAAGGKPASTPSRGSWPAGSLERVPFQRGHAVRSLTAPDRWGSVTSEDMPYPVGSGRGVEVLWAARPPATGPEPTPVVEPPATVAPVNEGYRILLRTGGPRIETPPEADRYPWLPGDLVDHREAPADAAPGTVTDVADDGALVWVQWVSPSEGPAERCHPEDLMPAPVDVGTTVRYRHANPPWTGMVMRLGVQHPGTSEPAAEVRWAEPDETEPMRKEPAIEAVRSLQPVNPIYLAVLKGVAEGRAGRRFVDRALAVAHLKEGDRVRHRAAGGPRDGIQGTVLVNAGGYATRIRVVWDGEHTAYAEPAEHLEPQPVEVGCRVRRTGRPDGGTAGTVRELLPDGQVLVRWDDAFEDDDYREEAPTDLQRFELAAETRRRLAEEDEPPLAPADTGWRRGDRVQIGDRPLITLTPQPWGTIEEITTPAEGEPAAAVRLHTGQLRQTPISQLRPGRVLKGDRVRHVRNVSLPLGTAGDQAAGLEGSMHWVNWNSEVRPEMAGDLVPVNESYIDQEPATAAPAPEPPRPHTWQLTLGGYHFAEGEFTEAALTQADETSPRLREGDRLTLQFPTGEQRSGTVREAGPIGVGFGARVDWDTPTREQTAAADPADPDLQQGDRVQRRDQEDHVDLPPLQGTIERVQLRVGGSTAEVDWDNGHIDAELPLTELAPAPVAEGSLVRGTPELAEQVAASGVLEGRVTALVGTKALVVWSVRTTMVDADRLQPVEEPVGDPPPLEPGERVSHLNSLGVPDGADGTVVELAGDRVLVDWDDGHRNDVALDRVQRQLHPVQMPEIQVRRGGVTYPTPSAAPAGDDGADIPAAVTNDRTLTTGPINGAQEVNAVNLRAIPDGDSQQWTAARWSQPAPARPARDAPTPTLEVGELVQVTYALPGGTPRRRGRLLDIKGGRCLVDWPDAGEPASYPLDRIERAPFQPGDRAELRLEDSSRWRVTILAVKPDGSYEFRQDVPRGWIGLAELRHLPPERDLPEQLRPGGRARKRLGTVLRAGLGTPWPAADELEDELAAALAPWFRASTLTT